MYVDRQDERGDRSIDHFFLDLILLLLRLLIEIEI